MQWLRYGLDDWGTGVTFRAGMKNLLFYTMFGQVLRPTQFPIQQIPSPRDKVVAVSSWPLASTSIEINNAWTYISSPPYVFTAWYLVKHTHNFISALAIIMRVS
jgi:hypothetical protein